jgi:CRISPR-associated protein Csb1
VYGEEPHEKVSILQAGHRIGDAIVRCTLLAPAANAAFLALRRGDAEPMAKLAPTSLVFGVWDSRDTGVKVPRLVQSVIRAWSVTRLSRSAQFVPALDYPNLGIMEAEEKLKKDEKNVLAERGFLHVPSTGDHGGIVADGPIRRDVTVNLIALRRLDGPRGPALRRYLLGLGLIAASEPLDPFLRQGCMLVPDSERPSRWTLVGRDGTRTELALDATAVQAFARDAAGTFGVAAPRTERFDAKLAKQDMAKGKKK